MINIKRRIGILAAVFALMLVIGMINSPGTQSAEEEGGSLEAASLPVVCAEWNGQLINPLYGYTTEVRDSVVEGNLFPFLEDELSMTLHLLDGRERPKSVSYELRSEDGTRLIDRGEARLDGHTRDLFFTITMQDLLEEGRPYRLKLVVTMSTCTASYHTRVCKLNAPEDAEDLTAMIDYGVQLHQALFSRSEAASYAVKLETAEQSDKNTLSHVDIHGNFNQFAWGDAQIEPASDSYLTIQAYQPGYAYLSHAYLVKTYMAENAPVVLRVKETMTLQRTSGKIYLLRYDRDAEQLWEPSEQVFQSDGILLGLQDEQESQMMKSQDEAIVAFTAAGDLYAYDGGTQTLTRVFSFRNEGEHALRTLCRMHSLRIMDVHDDGSVEFILYGYMNGGFREGACGMSYYRYEPETGVLSEKMYIESDKTHAQLKQDVETLFSKGNDRFLYFHFNDQVYVMDFSSGETAVLVKQGESASLVVSPDGAAFAWQSGLDQEMPQSIRVLNLRKGSNEIVEAPEGTFVRTLGFIREDLIVGFGDREGDKLSNGLREEPVLNRLEILDEELTPYLEYAEPGVCLAGIRQESFKMNISRFTWLGGQYQYLPEDVMLRGDGAESEASEFSFVNHEKLMRMLLVPYARLATYVRVTQESFRSVSRSAILALPSSASQDTEQGKYLAYGRGRLLAVTADLGSAVALAAADYGYVTDASGHFLWYWSNREGSAELDGGHDKAYADGKSVLDLSGNVFRALVYYLDRGIPLLWHSPEGGDEWIIGYDWGNAVLYEPQDGRTHKLAQSLLDEKLLRENNHVWAFVD